MEWVKHMNDALSYMEDNLDGEISIEKAARLARCSPHHLRRMFSYITGTPLSEHLRRRRITKAAFDLRNGDKVLDVALRYGYESPTAFNRAFQAIHGISPSAAQKSDAALKTFPPVSLQITVKGVTQMDYRIVEKEGFRVVGIRIKIEGGSEEEDGIIASFLPEEEDKIIDSFWDEACKKGQPERIKGLINGKPAGLIGLFVDADSRDSGYYYYVCGVTDKPAPEGMHEANIPKHTWAVFAGADEPSTKADLFHRICSEWLPNAGYEFAAGIDMEVYFDSDPNDSRYEIWIPVVKKRTAGG